MHLLLSGVRNKDSHPYLFVLIAAKIDNEVVVKGCHIVQSHVLMCFNSGTSSDGRKV